MTYGLKRLEIKIIFFFSKPTYNFAPDMFIITVKIKLGTSIHYCRSVPIQGVYLLGVDI